MFWTFVLAGLDNEEPQSIFWRSFIESQTSSGVKLSKMSKCLAVHACQCSCAGCSHLKVLYLEAQEQSEPQGPRLDLRGFNSLATRGISRTTRSLVDGYKGQLLIEDSCQFQKMGWEGCLLRRLPFNLEENSQAPKYSSFKLSTPSLLYHSFQTWQLQI